MFELLFGCSIVVLVLFNLHAHCLVIVLPTLCGEFPFIIWMLCYLCGHCSVIVLVLFNLFVWFSYFSVHQLGLLLGYKMSSSSDYFSRKRF